MNKSSTINKFSALFIIAIAILGIPAISLAGLLPEFDPLFTHEPPCGTDTPRLPPADTGFMDNEKPPPYLYKLNLTDTQKGNVQALMQRNKADMQQTLKTGREYFLYVQSQIFSDEYAEDKIAALLKKTMPFHEQVAINMAKLDREIFELLTPEQQRELNDNLVKLSECLKGVVQ